MNLVATCECDTCLLDGLVANDQTIRQQAWQRWYERDKCRLHAYVSRRCYSLGCSEQSDDIVQDTFVIAYDNFCTGRFQYQDKALCAYLYGIARNLIYAALRRRGKESALEIDCDQPDHRNVNIDERVCLTDFLATVAEARSCLAPGKRRVLDGLYMAGKDSQQLGRELALSAVNVRAIASRAVIELRVHVAQRYPAEL